MAYRILMPGASGGAHAEKCRCRAGTAEQSREPPRERRLRACAWDAILSVQHGDGQLVEDACAFGPRPDGQSYSEDR